MCNESFLQLCPAYRSFSFIPEVKDVTNFLHGEHALLKMLSGLWTFRKRF